MEGRILFLVLEAGYIGQEKGMIDCLRKCCGGACFPLGHESAWRRRADEGHCRAPAIAGLETLVAGSFPLALRKGKKKRSLASSDIERVEKEGKGIRVSFRSRFCM